MLKLQKVLNKRATLLRVNWSQIKRCQLLQVLYLCATLILATAIALEFITAVDSVSVILM